ncbi:putative membrane protein [Clostridium sp. CAG:632]|nr:putative membrane protein [Clostridium sp. CAG:632]
MFRTQIKLFFRSPLRLILLAVLFGGSLYYYGPMFLAWFQGQVYYAGLGKLQEQLINFVYVFLLFLFLAFDYFREVPDANIDETLKANKNCLKQDLVQALVMILVVLVYAFWFVIMHIACHISDGTYTTQVLFYYFRLTGTYYILDGIVAILAGWLFARNAGKIIGYIELIVFAFIVSPIMSSQFENYSYFVKWITYICKIFLLMPQGANSIEVYCMPMAGLLVAARGIFWIGVFSGTLAIYFLQHRRNEKRHKTAYYLSILTSAICAIWGLIYSGLPASYYCSDNFISDDDDQWRYTIEGVKQEEREADFQILSYDMDLKLGRQMTATVTCVPSDGGLDSYAMTLYRLYQVDSVIDENGDALEYQQDENTLLIYGQEDGIRSFTLKYHGGPTGASCLYNNWYAINLPGWFPYYPVPGWNKIYQNEGEYRYVDNRLKTPARFRIQLHADGKVYSDLKQEGNNLFQGESYGPTLLSGFVGERKLANGTVFIYPYLDAPSIEETKDSEDYVVDKIRQEGNKIQLIIQLPGIPVGEPGIYEEDRIIADTTFVLLRAVYEDSGQFDWRKDIVPTTEEDQIEIVKMLYYNFKENEDGEVFYENVKDMYLTHMQEFGYTEDGFEEFIIKNLGQEEWDYLNK